MVYHRTVEIVEYSSIKKSITFDVIHSDPPLPFTSMVQTISLSKVTLTNETFIKWASDFSNDATAEVLTDSSYKRLDAFRNLSFVCQELQDLSFRVNDIEARSRSNSCVSSPRSRSSSMADGLVGSPSRTGHITEQHGTSHHHVNFSNLS